MTEHVMSPISPGKVLLALDRNSGLSTPECEPELGLDCALEFWPLIAAFALGGVALFTRVLNRSVITLPMVCLATGTGLYALGGVPFHVMDDGLRIVAEVTLAIVLFADAAHLNLARFRQDGSWPLRMLVIGLPLALVLGTLVFLPLFDALPFWQIVLMAALLAPTDAALGQAVFSNEKVPERVREALTAESGLNDGLALPAIIFVACAAVGFNHDLNQSNWVLFAGQQIGFGILFGAVLGIAGGWAAHEAVDRNFAAEENSAIFALSLVAMAYFLAELVGGNSFVAVFVAGLFFGRFAKDSAERARKFLETEGVLLMMIAFLYIGAIIVPKGLAGIDGIVVLAVLLALFVVRPLAIWLSLVGSNADTKTRLFLGWFGPRGLATALFTLLVLSEFEGKLMSETILAVTALAVLASTVLHGVSAHFAASVFGGEQTE